MILNWEVWDDDGEVSPSGCNRFSLDIRHERMEAFGYSSSEYDVSVTYPGVAAGAHQEASYQKEVFIKSQDEGGSFVTTTKTFWVCFIPNI